MKHIRNTTLFYCILSLTLISGCSLDEPNDLDLKCFDEQHQLSQIFYELENGNTTQTIVCSNDVTDNGNCDLVKINFEKGYCPYKYSCIKNKSNQDSMYSCVKNVNSFYNEDRHTICNNNDHFVKMNNDSIDSEFQIDVLRCTEITQFDKDQNNHVIGYCCKDDDTHCGLESVNCKTMEADGWEDAYCQLSDKESPKCVPECADDYQYDKEKNDCLQLECGDNKHIDHHECVDDTTEQCGDALIDCNSLSKQLISDYQVHGFACVKGNCTLVCSDGYHPDDYNTACVDECNEKNCGANSHCVSYSTNCIEGEEKYISCDYKTQIDDNNNISIVSQECLNNETIINISTFPIPLDCIEVEDIGGAVYCIKYSYCSKYNYESRCECNSGFVNNLSGDCVSTENCDEDGYITLYHNSNLIKAWCIQSKDDFIQMKDGLKQYDRWPEDNVNNAYYVANDISLGNISMWEPIGTQNNKFKNALFLGNGHIIDGNLTCSQHCGLFGFIDNTIISDINLSLNIQSNLKVTSFTIIWNLVYSVGSLVTDAQNSTIENVSAYGILQSSGLGIGGIIGISRNSSVIDSSFHGTIQGGYASGGIISHIYCSDNKITNITGCHASGYFEADDVGGIIGGNLGKNNCGMAISHSGFSGTLCADKSAGGIVGVSGRDAIISYSSVLDAMIKMKTDATNNNILHGGIAGSGENIHISNSYTLRSTILGAHAGGLVGNITNPTIQYSYFDGIVRGLYSAGGLVGMATHLVIEESGVFGKIYGTLDDELGPVSWAGNFVGETTTCHIYNSFSTAHIIAGESASTFGTINLYTDFYSDLTEISFMQNPTSVISNSYSLGDIYSSAYFDSEDIFLHSFDELSITKGDANNVFIFPKYEAQMNDPTNHNHDISGTSYMYNNIGYIYLKPNEKNQRIPYIGYSKTISDINEFTTDDEMLSYLNQGDPHPDPYPHLWNYFLCNLSTGPDLNETAEYLIPIPEEFPSIPFCKPYVP